MRTKSINYFIFIITLVSWNSFLFSQDSTTINKEPILISIEDSLKGRLILENDSTWINQQLELQHIVLNFSNIYYKLVKIEKRRFTEGPKINHPFNSNKKTPYNFKYGDSTYSIIGKKLYTYIGNSSWGYNYKYTFHRVYPIKRTELKIKHKPNTCEHGWDILRGQACYQCLHQYKMQYDSNFKKNAYYNKLHKIKSTRFCKHNFDGHRGEGCPQCRDEDKIKTNSIYEISDSINRNIPLDCNHGHLCCDTDCPCCPEDIKILRKKEALKKLNKAKTIVSPSQIVELSFHYGMLLPHHNEVAYLNQKNISGAELSYVFQTNGKKDWEELYKFPKKGISLLYFNLSSEKNLGKALGILPFINFPITKLKGLGIKVGYGLGYIEKPFHINTNRKNLVIGSKINALFYTGVNYNTKLFQNLGFHVGVNITHFSNGSFKMPNLGINNLTANIGFQYTLIETSTVKKPRWCGYLNRNWEYYILSTFATKNIEIQNNERYPVISLIGDAIKPISRKLVAGAGLNLFYNKSIITQISLLDTSYSINKNDNYRIGVHGSFGFKIGRNHFILQQGIYLKTPENFQGMFYHRLASRFYIYKNLYANFSLKSHFAVADYFEFGIGIKL